MDIQTIFERNEVCTCSIDDLNRALDEIVDDELHDYYAAAVAKRHNDWHDRSPLN